MLNLKRQYFGHLMWRADLFEKTLMLEKIEGKSEGEDRMKWLDSITDSMDMSLGELHESGVGDGQGSLACCSSWGHKQSDTTERLNWTDTYQQHFSSKQSPKQSKSENQDLNIDKFTLY